MRADMPKVIVERPRSGAGKLRNRDRVRGDGEDLPASASMKRDARQRGGHKRLNENLAPLKRYLASQTGRPWNKVWAEICKNLKPSNTVQQHVRDHIDDFVARSTTLKNGVVWVQGRCGYSPLKESGVRLYVDPKSGLLRANKHWTSIAARRRAHRERVAKELNARMREIAPGRQLHLLDDGAWWEVTLAATPKQKRELVSRHGTRQVPVDAGVVDVVERAGLSKTPRHVRYGGHGVYAVAKRQLSRKEMRALELR